jgi:hypothetical protein
MAVATALVTAIIEGGVALAAVGFGRTQAERSSRLPTAPAITPNDLLSVMNGNCITFAPDRQAWSAAGNVVIREA